MDFCLYCRWLELVDLLKTVILSSNNYSPMWMLDPCGQSFVKSFYNAINSGGRDGVVYTLKDLMWKPPITYLFVWLVINNKILYKI